MVLRLKPCGIFNERRGTVHWKLFSFYISCSASCFWKVLRKFREAQTERRTQQPQEIIFRRVFFITSLIASPVALSGTLRACSVFTRHFRVNDTFVPPLRPLFIFRRASHTFQIGPPNERRKKREQHYVETAQRSKLRLNNATTSPGLDPGPGLDRGRGSNRLGYLLVSLLCTQPVTVTCRSKVPRNRS